MELPHWRRRRRPPPLWSSLLLLLGSYAATPALAQSTTTLALPSTTAFNVTSSASSSTYYISPTTSGSVFVTLSLCSPPSSLSALPSVLPIALYVSNSSSITSPGPSSLPLSSTLHAAQLKHGFANLTVAATSGAWIGVWAPNDSQYGGDGTGTWGFSLGVSSGSALVVRDAGAGTAFDDTDESHALLTTANYSAPGVAGAAPNYTLLVMPSTNLSAALQASTCYLESASGLVPQNRVIANTTTRGYGGGERLQFEVEGLTKGTNYSSWLVEGNTNGSTRLWLPVSFVTKSGTNCRLLHSLSFCPQVAYSVPSPATLSTASLISYYNTTVTPSLTAFARTLTTFPCDDITMGGYSFVSTCDDCYNSYETWACAIALPRCTDAPSNATLETTDSSSNSSAAWVIPTSYEQLLLRENPAASRTPDFAPSLLSTTFPGLINATETADSETPFPYSEVPPCLDTCQQVGARCPPFIGWGCPSAQIDGGTGTAGYGLTKPVTKGDRMGGGIGGSNMLAGDRYGNVFCNALGTDMISSVQTPTKSAATSSVSTPLWRSLVVAVGSVAGWLLVA